MEKRLMNIKELSAYLGTPKGSIYTMVCLRKIPQECVIKLGRSLRFEKDGIDRWITENRASPGAST
jgi:excisionase family DNA binding protein